MTGVILTAAYRNQCLARPRAFQEDKALDAAIECFWRHGLDATSVRDLADEMGINAPSLYNAFGDKRALFARALERYAHGMRERLQQREEQHAPKAAIQIFFRDLITRSLADTDRRGCFIVNSVIDVAPHDDDLRVAISSYLAEIESFFLRCLQRAQASGEIPASAVPEDIAQLFVGVALGLQVLARANPERALLEGMLRPALALLDHPNQPVAKGTT